MAILRFGDVRFKEWKRPVNVLSAFTGRFVVGCLVVLVVLVIGMDFGLFWTDLLAADWWCLMAIVRKDCIGEWSFMDFVMNCCWFWFFCNFLSRFLHGCCGCYRPLVSGFAGWLKLIVIKNLCKTVLLWICWNNLCARCWRVEGKCVIFGFFAADTATKQPKWLIRKCRSTAL